MIIFETEGHVGILDGNRGVRLNETNNPKDQCEDQRGDGQDQPACQPQRGQAGLAEHLHLLLLLLFFD